jgi:hypothetical protein
MTLFVLATAPVNVRPPSVYCRYAAPASIAPPLMYKPVLLLLLIGAALFVANVAGRGHDLERVVDLCVGRRGRAFEQAAMKRA